MAEIKTYYAGYHQTAAAHTARIAGEAEEALRTEDEELADRMSVIHDSMVISSIIESYAGVEATINEAIDTESNLFWEYHEDLRPFFDAYPGDFIREESTMKKYQIILYITDSDPFEPGKEPYQSANIVRRLRNYFIHHDPEFAGGSPEEPDTRLGKALKTKDFELNPFHDGYQFFPGNCLSYGCAQWAFAVCLDFIDKFYGRIEIEPQFELWREILEEELSTDWSSSIPE